MAYKKYDPKVKKMIAESGQPNLFPELKIPRTTALYWISKSKEVSRSEINISDDGDYYYLKKEIFKLKGEKELLQKVLVKVLDLKPLQSLLGIQKKEYIVKTIDEMRGLLAVTEALRLIDVSTDQYYRWRSEIYGCDTWKKKCDSTRPNQLTRAEQKKLVEMAQDKKFAHMSIKSLMFYAQRENILFCGYDSWLKYIKMNNVKRYKVKRAKKKTYRIGIRAKRPHEIWHIDITEIRINQDEKFYIQMIVDNYSRTIMSWRISDHKDLHLSLKTIKKSLRSGDFPDYLMSDAGRENINNEVIKLLLGRGISQMIARADVQFSNSMIEAVFKRMKGVIDFRKVHTQLGLKRKIGWFVNQYNSIVPHSKLDGAIPVELLKSQFDSSQFKQVVHEMRVKLIRSRSLDYQKCNRCFRA